jgi:molybdenum-dependent DNA-binding transcriptional regulator ModE
VTKTTKSTAKPNAGQRNVIVKNEAVNTLTDIKVKELLDAVETLGIVHHACQAVGVNNKLIYRQIAKDPTFADRLRAASAIGTARRRDYLESLAYEMATANPTMVMFLLKREDPSYRESYNVNSTSQPTTYEIDLGLPENPTPIADVTPARILE